MIEDSKCWVILHVQIFRGSCFRPEYDENSMKLNQLCAICDAKFAGKQELIHHANEIHQKTTNPTKSSRNIAPPKRLANQLLRESKQKERKRDKQLATQYQISMQQIIFPKLFLPICSYFVLHVY